MSEFIKIIESQYNDSLIKRREIHELRMRYLNATEEQKLELDKLVTFPKTKNAYIIKIKEDLENNKISVDEFITANENYQSASEQEKLKLDESSIDTNESFKYIDKIKADLKSKKSQ